MLFFLLIFFLLDDPWKTYVMILGGVFVIGIIKEIQNARI